MKTLARSISRPVRERLRREAFVAQALAVFERACNLLTPEGEVLALVMPPIGDGPLNVVVEGRARGFAGIEPGTPARLESEQIRVGKLSVDLDMAALWEPRPDWKALRARRDALRSRLPLLRAFCLRHAPPHSFLALLEAPSSTDATLSTALKAAEALREGWGGNLERLSKGAARLAGLGSGLTPSGDDFLSGAMLRAWLVHPAPGALCCALAQAAAPRTTTLSAALLRAAARGECGAPWHALLAALSAGDETKITAAAQEVLAHGATSGADGLAGFLWV